VPGYHYAGGVYRPHVVMRAYFHAELSGAATPAPPAAPPAVVPPAAPTPRTQGETDIANRALIFVGDRRIGDLNDGSILANTILERFDEVRDELLRSMPWNFATKRSSLPASSVVPLFGFAREFPLPVDCARLLEVEDRDQWGYRVEGRSILTSMPSPINIVYTAHQTDLAMLDSQFCNVWAAALAVDIVEAITADSGKLASVYRKFTRAWHAAAIVNGQEPDIPEREDGIWARARGRLRQRLGVF